MESKSEEKNGDERRVHPKSKANILSKLFFLWMFPTFYKGYRKDLTEDDLYQPLKEHESERLGDVLEAAWNKEVNSKRNPSLWMALFKVFWKDFVFSGFVFLIWELVIKLSQPLNMAKLMGYYVPGQTEVSQEEAYFASAMIVVASFAMVMVAQGYFFYMHHIGMKVRIACCSLIYRKALRLSKAALNETTVGQMVNLLSNDVSRFDNGFVHIHNLWMAPIESSIVLYLLYSVLGPASTVGAGLLYIFIPLQFYLGKLTSKFRLSTALKTDERVRLMNEIISGIQVIKMYAWEKPFAKLIELARRVEIKQIRNNAYVQAVAISCMMLIHRMAIYLCILVYTLTIGSPNHLFVYTLIAYYNILRQVLVMFLPQAVTQIAESNISVKRIQKFLLHSEIDYEKPQLKNSKAEINALKSEPINGEIKDQVGNVGIYMEGVTAKWSLTLDNVLENVDFNVGPGQLVAIVGPVGCGKTSLLHVILKELPLVQGHLEIGGSISYASQEPWLFASSIKQNILFGEQFDSVRYNEVVRVCALERDFQLFPQGDRTVVGERGVMLSGGQRARINLARAVYKKADNYILDDPLSAVDPQVGKQLFEECICGFLKEKCVVLVTHQLQYLVNVSRIYLLENGKVTESGTYEHLLHSGKDFTKLLDDKNDEDVKQEPDKNEIKLKEDGLNNKSTNKVKEQQSTGSISKQVYFNYIRSGGICKFIFIMIILTAAQISYSGTEYFLSFWVNLEQDKTGNLNSSSSNSTEEINEPYFTKNILLYIYSALIAAAISFTLWKLIAFCKFCMTASQRLHNRMFGSIVLATMKFFNDNPSGRIMNRFSKDMGCIDEILPSTMINALQLGLIIIAHTCIIGSVAPITLIASAILLSLFYCYRIGFLATSRDLKRLEGITRSPVFSHLTASLQGLTTIRAFGAQNILIDEFDGHQNLHSSAFYLFLGANATFGFWLDMHCAVFIGLVTLSFFFIQNETYGGNVGLALTQSMSMTGMFQWGIRQWSELSNQMTSVERITEYINLEAEKDNGTITPPTDWPKEGKIEFDNLSFKYSRADPYVLKNLKFVIHHKEKIGIVGRTGAGKSSIISALFRLAELDGRIILDGLDIAKVPLKSFRSKISIIPQEPVLFSGSLRKNLDPFEEFSDMVLWNALEEVELKAVVSDLPHGLESKMSEGGSNFSVGQRQLVCLARAIIRSSKILVLDEATANVDPQTDALIQKTIRNKFAECTVLTIAHRLHTIMDSDKVLVLDAGQVVEFDQPFKLLQNSEGVFSKLVEQTGKAMADNLTAIAKEVHNFSLKKE